MLRVNIPYGKKMYRHHNHGTPTIGNIIQGLAVIIYLILAQTSGDLYVCSSPLGPPDESIETESPVMSKQDAQEYLRTFGYLGGTEADSLGEDALTEAVMKFQKTFHLTVTGNIDDEMVQFMGKGRCGNKDFDEDEYIDGRRKDVNELHSRYKRFALYGSSWRKTSLKYHIMNYPRSMRMEEVNRTIATAFGIWSKVAKLKFSPSHSGVADIWVKFHRLGYNCEKTFDRTIKGHAWFPTPISNSTAIHFNEDIQWTSDTNSKDMSLLATAIHEIGHALGLSHSVANTKMYPIENGLVDLTDDDIKAIQALYTSRDRDKFFIRSGKIFVAENLNGHDRKSADQRFLYKKKANLLDDCKKYLAANNYLVGLWNKTESQCYIKRTYANPEVTFYTKWGHALGHHDIYADVEDFYNSTTMEGLKRMITIDKNCDRIVKLENWPAFNETIYKCKRYADDDCCTIIFMMGKEVNLPSALTATK